MLPKPVPAAVANQPPTAATHVPSVLAPHAVDNWSLLQARLTAEAAVLVTVVKHQGSVPREAGAWMLVFSADSPGGPALFGTIGGGHLELQATHQASAMLAAHAPAHAKPPVTQQRVALGPSLGQCCGGAVELRYEWVGGRSFDATKSVATNPMNPETDAKNLIKNLQAQSFYMPTLALFGGGHVGSAIVQVCSQLPMPISWIDSRDEVFPTDLPAQVRAEHSNPVQAAVADVELIPSGSRVLVMSFSHAEDLEIVANCLQRQRNRADLPFIGLIGSKTKWATFKHRLEARGFSAAELAHVTCPIGMPGITGKEPGVIAVAVAAQLLGL